MNREKSVESIIRAMILAPSAHNTQPWKFAVKGDTINIFVDWDRHLTVSDPTERELYVSIGCAIENGRVAAAMAGKSMSIAYFPEGRDNSKPAAQLVLREGGAEQELAQLYPAIRDRRTNRLLYDAQPLLQEERGALSEQSSEIVFVDDRKKIDETAEVSGRGTFSTLSRKDFKEELSRWVRNSWTRKPDGMPGYAMGIPAPISLLMPLMVKLAPIHKKESESVRAQIKSSSAIVVIITENDQREDWVRAGQLLERMWLKATAAGLAACTHAAAVEASEETRGELRKFIGTRNHPQAILRIGHAPTTNLKATPRRSVEDCLVR